MKRNMKLGLLVVLTGLMAGCTKDIKDDIDDLSRPIPTAIILMSSQMVAQNGTMLALPFRVNPSNYEVKIANLSLDVLESHVARSSYISSMEEYSLQGVEARTDGNGDVIEGEWIAKIKINDGQYYSDAMLALVLKYTDVHNKPVMITSSTFTFLNTRVKFTDKMIALKTTPASSYCDAENKPIPSYIQIATCPISEGSLTVFSLKDVKMKDVALVGESAKYFDLKCFEASSYRYTVVPKLLTLLDGKTQFVSADIQFTMVDINSGDEITKQVSIKYYATTYTMPVTEISISKIIAEFDAGKKPSIFIPMGDALAQIGVTSDLFASAYPPTVITSTVACFDENDQSTDIPILCRDNENNDATKPEKTVMNLSFYAKPLLDDLGNYYIRQEFDYKNIFEKNSRIHAVIKLPIRFIE